MKNSTLDILRNLIARYPALSVCEDDIHSAYLTMEAAYKSGKKLLIAGNGGSAADSEHIVGELLKQFKKKRMIDEKIYDALGEYGDIGLEMREHLEGGLPAIALTSHPALSTAFSNDTEPTLTFAQQLLSLGEEGDVLLCLSTSGNSKNCVYATVLAKAKGITTICMTGEKESKLSELCDVSVRVPERETYLVQEYHLPIYHALCAMLEEEFF